MKIHKKSLVIGIIVLAVLWVFYVAYEKAQFDYQQNFPKPLPSKIVTPPIPSNKCVGNCKG